MGQLSISKATSSNMTDNVDDVTVDAVSTDGISDEFETRYSNDKWSTWFGYYVKIPEVKTAIDMRATWTIGNGYEADARTSAILDHISGNGTDNFNSILKNMMIVRRVNGDAYAEIVKDEDSGIIINIKPLDPASVTVIYDGKGRVKRYEQTSKLGEKKKTITLTKDKVFHLVNKRVADEIHGRSDIEAIEEIIKANNESFFDMKKVMHRYVKPMMKFEVDTSDQTEIDAFVAKMDAIVNKGENIYIPKGAVTQELISVPSNSTLNPLPWREHLKNYFYQVVGIPQIVLGNAAEFSESSAKIAYLAFEQSVDDEQNEIEAQIWNQLKLRVTLSFPASLRNELLSDESKDGANSFKPSDTTAGVGA